MTIAATVVVGAGTPDERAIPIEGRLLVGRECAGAEPSRRLILDDPAVSREHFELRVHPARGAILVDLSTNGTHVNGRLVERGESIALADGDTIEVAGIDILFTASTTTDPVRDDARSTVRLLNARYLVAVVGDVIGYTALSEAHGAAAVGEASEAMFAAISKLAAASRGTVSSYPGDAVFVAWDAGRDSAAPARAVSFAVDAADLISGLGETLGIRTSDGPVRMGWGVALGETASSRPSPGREVVHGDAVNLAFRLAALAGRDDRAHVLVTEGVAAAAPSAAAYGAVEELAIRGRAAPARVRAATRGV